MPKKKEEFVQCSSIHGTEFLTLAAAVKKNSDSIKINRQDDDMLNELFLTNFENNILEDRDIEDKFSNLSVSTTMQKIDDDRINSSVVAKLTTSSGVLLNLNRNYGYVSKTASIIQNFNQDLKESILNDLKIATISVTIFKNNEKYPLGCLKKWLDKKLSGQIWYEYISESWNEDSKQFLFLERIKYVRLTTSTIFYLFLQISQVENDQLMKKSVDKFVVSENNFIFSLYEVLLMMKSMYLQKMELDNNIIFLGYLCKNTSAIMGTKNSSINQTIFSAHKKRKAITKQICSSEETEAKKFVMEVLTQKSSPIVGELDLVAETSSMSINDIYDMAVNNIKIVDVSEKEDEEIEIKSPLKKKRRKSRFDIDDDEEQQQKEELVLLLLKKAKSIEQNELYDFQLPDLKHINQIQ
jgi:hypothetical protein